MKNRDYMAPWHLSKFKDDPKAPHSLDPDNQERPWNKTFWHPEQLSMEERKYYGIDFTYYQFKKYVYGKSSQ